MELILDVLLPETDASVLAQLIVVAVLFGLALWRFWKNPDVRLLVIGSGLLVFGFMGFRALH